MDIDENGIEYIVLLKPLTPLRSIIVILLLVKTNKSLVALQVINISSLSLNNLVKSGSWSLKFTNVPIGVSTYNIKNQIPEDILEKLPTEEDINLHIDLPEDSD